MFLLYFVCIWFLGRRPPPEIGTLVSLAQAELTETATEELRSQLLNLDYFHYRSGTDAQCLADVPSVQDFLQRVRDHEYDQIVRELNLWLNRFVDAERVNGNMGRPALIDYDIWIMACLLELQRRSGFQSGD